MPDDPLILPRAFLKMCHRNWGREKVADSLGTSLTGGDLLLRSLILRRILLRDVLAADEKFVGLLLPPSAGGVVANAAMPLMGRIGVNLNYTLSTSLLNYCIEQCGIRHVLTSRRFMERLKLEVHAELVYLEDFAAKASWRDKLVAFVQGRLLPLPTLERHLGVDRLGSDDLLTVIFTSGSTGNPKGVMLSQANVGSNIQAIGQIVRLGPEDVAIGVLPFFHSYGYLTGLWTALALEAEAGVPFQPARRAAGRQTLPRASGDRVPGHAHICSHVFKTHARGRFSHARRRVRRGRALFAGNVRRVREKIRHPAARSLRLHRAVAARGGEHPAEPQPRRRQNRLCAREPSAGRSRASA